MAWHKHRLSMSLRDGRSLTWYEFGDPEGKPCIYTCGTPASGWGGSHYHEPAKQAGVRWISVDKPGFGGSDHQPQRRLLYWPDDISQLADHLKLKRFSVAGQSGGGPHALALCYGLPKRVSTGVILAGMGPVNDPSVLESMSRGNRRLFWTARHAPLLLWPLLLLLRRVWRKLHDPNRDWEEVKRELSSQLPPSDISAWEPQDVRELIFESLEDAFVNGVEGAVQDLLVCLTPWGFDVSEIKVPVEIWHGAEDRNIPIAIARYVARRIPSGTLHELPTAGHLLGSICNEDVMSVLARA